jgi:L-asparaginase / beta-aspartyl-peptidase
MQVERCRLAIHGGAGVIDRATLTPARETEFRFALARIAGTAWANLQAGASALDVVEQAVRDLEDFPLFNAGHGAVLNADGVAELDAAIMDGRSRAAGAIAGAKTPTHPITLARAVMERTEHVLLVGEGADRLARDCAIEQSPPEYFITAERAEQQRRAAASGRVTLDHDPLYLVPDPADKTGTVGAVARDAHGHLAAATSTGGMTNKHPGRVGDTPIIGAGTWAEDLSCAVSATGHGEFFLRSALAFDVHARMVYGSADLANACAGALGRVAELGGTGGLIAIDRDGHIDLSYNSEGMYRAWVGADGHLQVAIYAQ